jgi:hypothetical protein
MPPRNTFDQVIGYPGLQIGIWSWQYDRCFVNLWGLVVDSHFAVRVKFPDGQVFYLDDGAWGDIFDSPTIPLYAK